MNAAKQLELRTLLEKSDRTPKEYRRLDRLVRKLHRDHHTKWSTPEGMRQLVAIEALEEAEAVDNWAIFESLRAEQSLVLLTSSREKKRARLWIASDQSPWGTDRFDPAPDTLTITKHTTARQKAKRATRRYAS